MSRRLTEKDENGNWRVKGIQWQDIYEGKVITKELYERMYGAFYKLLQYEETELDPEKLEEIDRLYLEQCRELAEYRKIGSAEQCQEAADK